MKKSDAEKKDRIIHEWNTLAKERRQTVQQASDFAMLMKTKYTLSGGTGDSYQTIKSWLVRRLSLTPREL